MESRLPHDYPYPSRPHRLYAALTTLCDRECDWCSVYSSPRGKTFLSLEDFAAAFPREGNFEVQLEGGEPLVNPKFFDFVDIVSKEARCSRLILCTNGVLIPRSEFQLKRWLARFPSPLMIKISLNHYLLARDSGLVNLVKLLIKCVSFHGEGSEVVVNVRLRKGEESDDIAVQQIVKSSNIETHSNTFFLQRYGRASDRTDWDEPFLAGKNFTLLNPDGKTYGQDLIKRSEAMGRLP